MRTWKPTFYCGRIYTNASVSKEELMETWDRQIPIPRLICYVRVQKPKRGECRFVRPSPLAFIYTAFLLGNRWLRVLLALI